MFFLPSSPSNFPKQLDIVVFSIIQTGNSAFVGGYLQWWVIAHLVLLCSDFFFSGCFIGIIFRRG